MQFFIGEYMSIQRHIQVKAFRKFLHNTACETLTKFASVVENAIESERY